MSLEKDIQKIKNFLLDRYKDNLAAILIFGSTNTGHFKEGESDIDHMIFLKKLNKLNLDEESKFLFEKLKPYHFSTQYFNTLEGIKDYIKKRKSFSAYITIVSENGARVVYTTPEFEKTKEYLIKNPLTKKEIQEQLKEKDIFELEGYFKGIEGFNLTKALMSHLRRKLQVMNYFQNGNLIFDYEKCLRNINLKKEEKEKLEKLYNLYAERKSLTEKELSYYHNLAKKFSNQILK